eukprot:c28262_g1_i2 orf=590-1462(+)
MNHILADGQSAWHFMKSWAELCKGKDFITIDPIWDRSIIEEDDPTMDQYSLKRITSSHLPYTYDSALQEIVIHFSVKAVAKVKQEANSNREDGKTVSSYQALCAYLWKLITLARNLAPEETTGFNVVADCRRRLEPPVPSAYFGNAVRILTATSTAKDLEERDLSYAANLLKSAIDECTAETIRSHIHRLKENGYSWEWRANDVSVSSSVHFPVFENDFGWGKPVAGRSGFSNKTDGKITWFPGSEGGGSADAEITLNPTDMQRFQKLVTSSAVVGYVLYILPTAVVEAA